MAIVVTMRILAASRLLEKRLAVPAVDSIDCLRLRRLIQRRKAHSVMWCGASTQSTARLR